MEATVRSKRKLDFGKLTFSEKFLSSKESLEDVTPIDWSDEVKNGVKKATIFHPTTLDKRVDD